MPFRLRLRLPRDSIGGGWTTHKSGRPDLPVLVTVALPPRKNVHSTSTKLMKRKLATYHVKLIYQQDGSPPHFHLDVRDFLNTTMENRRICREQYYLPYPILASLALRTHDPKRVYVIAELSSDSTHCTTIACYRLTRHQQLFSTYPIHQKSRSLVQDQQLRHKKTLVYVLQENCEVEVSRILTPSLN
uniref:Uncharacterized protein n=1 Tax=Timema poppense TaxID=170557 RepID=A0A7R9DIP9_TIMPO|nr:unnamed protein product [Timema poppensis]